MFHTQQEQLACVSAIGMLDTTPLDDADSHCTMWIRSICRGSFRVARLSGSDSLREKVQK